MSMGPTAADMARITRQQREALNGHRGGLVYLTGLPGAGKSTLAALAERRLHLMRLRTYVLDGDELRRGLSRDLGFSDAARVENMRRATEAARLLVDAGIVVVAALIAPLRAERESAKAHFAPGDFMEVFVDAPLAVCEARDPKGLYRRARRGEIASFTGIDSSYEPPLHPDLHLDTTRTTPQEAADALLAGMRRFGLLAPERAGRAARPARGLLAD